MTSGSEVMRRQKMDTPWSIYRDFTVVFLLFKFLKQILNQNKIINRTVSFQFFKSNICIIIISLNVVKHYIYIHFDALQSYFFIKT